MSSTTQEITLSQTDELKEAPPAIETSWTSFVPMIFIVAIFYFLVIRPQEKKRKQHENLLYTLKKGEDVLTNSGIHGKISKVSESDSFVMLDIAENTTVKIERSAIVDITSRKASIANAKNTPESKSKK
jgi:preprotein translocase subunit YajC